MRERRCALLLPPPPPPLCFHAVSILIALIVGKTTSGMVSAFTASSLAIRSLMSRPRLATAPLRSHTTASDAETTATTAAAADIIASTTAIEFADLPPQQQILPRPVDDGKAYPQQTPHSGRHFLPSHPTYHRSRLRRVVGRLNIFRRNAHRTKRNRFMEGWYYRLTKDNASFAFIFSIDDPVSSLGGKYSNGTDLSLAACQVMGPDDGYIVQADRDDSKFWAWDKSQGLGCTFEWNDTENNNADDGDDIDTEMITAMHPDEWRQRVKTGFQMLPTSLQGRLVGRDGSEKDALSGSGEGPSSICDFDMDIQPLSGWGDDDASTKQRSTAGWLASFAVFEPHWQVTLADARATGMVNWNGTKYEFIDAPFYAEKNWGGSFPEHWYWVQCNAFDGYDRLSVTAGGGTRKIPLGQKESLGMVSIHYNGVFFEAVPWTGDMSWDVDVWGKWILKGRCTSGRRLFEAEVRATCNSQTTPGVTLRAPTKNDGLEYFCRDSFLADTTLSLWELHWDESKGDYVRGQSIIDGATSSQGGVEVGGGPWWSTWKASSKMKQPMKSLVAFPYAVQSLKRRVFRRKRR